ncbi:MAG TPA: hypothetical protein VIQ31_11275 [Phormidium sp.]
MGIACAIPSPQSLSEGLIHAADRHLYRAKQSGRNQIISHSKLTQQTAL